MRALTELIVPVVGLFFVLLAIHIATPVITLIPIIAVMTIPTIALCNATTADPAADRGMSTVAIITTAKIAVGNSGLLRSTKYAIAINPAIANTASKPGHIFFFFTSYTISLYAPSLNLCFL